MIATQGNRPDLLVAGANPAIDAYYRLDRLDAGEVNRVASVSRLSGGKANNLARVYQRLGGTPVTTGLVAGGTGRAILAGLSAEGIAHDYVCTEGESRQTVTVITPGETTVLLEPGPQVSAEALGVLAEKVKTLATAVPAVVLTGSLPPGAPPEYVAQLIDLVRNGSRALVAVDASGEALKLAAEAGPHLIKVNTDELAGAFGISTRCRAEVERLYQKLAESGVETLCLTGGERGALILSGEARFTVRTRVERFVSAVGAGDAFLAGYLRALGRGDSIQDAARLAAAAAAAALLEVEAGVIDPAEVDAALERTELLEADAFFAEGQP